MQVGTISEAYPHLILENLGSKLGLRTANVLKHLFPTPKVGGRPAGRLFALLPCQPTTLPQAPERCQHNSTTA